MGNEMSFDVSIDGKSECDIIKTTPEQKLAMKSNQFSSMFKALQNTVLKPVKSIKTYLKPTNLYKKKEK